MSAIQNFNYSTGSPTIKAPTLVICGDEDEGTPPDRNQLIASKIPGGRYEGHRRRAPPAQRRAARAVQPHHDVLAGGQPLGHHTWISPSPKTSSPSRTASAKLCAAVRRQVLAEEGQGRRLPRGLLPGHGRCRLARHRHAGGVWRRGARHHRGRDHDAGRGRIGRGAAGRLGHPSQRLRAQPDRGVRHRGAEEAHPARHHQGQGQGLLRRHRARRRPQHHGARHQGRARRQRLHRARQEDLHHDGVGRRQDAADRPHHAQGQVQAPDRRPVAVLHRLRPLQDRGHARSTRWAARRSTPTRSSSTA